MLSRPLKIVLLAILVVVAFFALRMHFATGQISAQSEIGDVSSGRFLAERWCAECHSVEPATAGIPVIAPDFSEIAQRPSTTALALRAFLQSEHETMPNFIVQPDDARDLIAYILSLRTIGRR